jgi:glutamate-1-semialdehyde 2,1-aminomutase
MFLSYVSVARPQSAERMNEWIAKQTARNPSCRGAFFVRPDDDPEWVRSEVRRLGLHGLKCYHTWAAVQPTWEAEIPDFLPEPLVRVANDEGWFITLHMVRARACADASNIYWIRRYCEQYPNMRLILAHSARGFQPAHNLEGLSQLTGLDNLYFDTSANCEPIAHQAVLRTFGSKRLMYGSDLPVSHLRGRSVAAADSFFFVEDDLPVWNAKQSKIEPVLLGLEHLRSLKWACWSERLNDEAIEDIFWNNAARVFDVR